MTAKTYNNNIAEIEVSLAIEQLLIAASPNTWNNTPGRVDVNNPPSGFVNLGAVVEDTPSLKVTREFFDLQTGIPHITQYQAITGLSAMFELNLHSHSWKKAQYMLGNYSAVASATYVATITSVTDRNTITINTTPTTLVVGMQITIMSSIATTAIQIAADAIESIISSMNTASTTFTTFYLLPTPIKTPTVGQNIYFYRVAKQLFGTSKITNYTLLGVADTVQGDQIIHYISKCQPAGDTTEEIRPAQNIRPHLAFKAFGVTVTAPDATDQLVVAERYYVPAGF